MTKIQSIEPIINSFVFLLRRRRRRRLRVDVHREVEALLRRRRPRGSGQDPGLGRAVDRRPTLQSDPAEPTSASTREVDGDAGQHRPHLHRLPLLPALAQGLRVRPPAEQHHGALPDMLPAGQVLQDSIAIESLNCAL